MKKMFVIFAVIASATVYAGTVEHSGGTDAAGCHTDRTTGVYHCH